MTQFELSLSPLLPPALIVALAIAAALVVALAIYARRPGALLRAIVRPAVPSAVAAGLVLVALARWWSPQTLAALAPLGALWTLVCAAFVWRLGFAPPERARIRRELFRRPSVADTY